MCFEVRIVSQAFGLLCRFLVGVDFANVGFDEFAAPLKSHFHVTQLCICIWMCEFPFQYNSFKYLKSEISCIFLTSWVYSMLMLCIFFESPIQLVLWQCKFTQHMKCVSLNFCLASWLHSATSVTKIALLHTISFLFRPRSTPTPTGSISANGVPTEALDYDRLKQVLLRTNK